MGDMTFITYVEVGDEELDGVEVHIDQSPEEKDVNWGGSFEMVAAIYKGENVMPKMTDDAIESTEQRLYQELCDSYEDERY